MQCDLLFLAHSRPEFTRESVKALIANTNWERVSQVIVYTDGEETPGFAGAFPIGVPEIYVLCKFGGPVAIMSHYLSHDPAPVWAKIDNDVIVPPGWLDQALLVMETRQELDFLGLEPPLSRTPAPWRPNGRVIHPETCIDYTQPLKTIGYASCDSIGGVGLMRTSAFQDRRQMQPFATYGGFTDWQTGHPELVKGWIVPPINLFLLDRIATREPWASLNKRYLAEKLQRPWTNYSDETVEKLAGWWLDGK